MTHPDISDLPKIENLSDPEVVVDLSGSISESLYMTFMISHRRNRHGTIEDSKRVYEGLEYMVKNSPGGTPRIMNHLYESLRQLKEAIDIASK